MKHRQKTISVRHALMAALVLIYTLGTCASSCADSGTVIVGGKTVPFITAPFTDSDGTLYAPVDLVKILGGSYTPLPNDRVSVTTAAQKSITFASRPTQGRSCVSVSELAKFFDADYHWDRRTRTAALLSKLRMVRVQGNQLIVTTSYPVRYQVGKLKRPDRVFVDLMGTQLGVPPVSVVSSNSGVNRIRTGAMPHSVTRIVLDVKMEPNFTVASSSDDNRIVVDLGPLIAQAPPPSPPAVIRPEPPAVRHTTTDAGTEPAPAPSSITSVNVVASTINTPMQIVVSTRGPSQYRTLVLDNPRRLAFDVRGAVLDPSVPTSIQVGDDTVRSVRVGSVTEAKTLYGRVVVDLSQQAAYTIVSAPTANGDGTDYTITIVGPSPVPLASTSPLRGKVIVIDPGHGGDDSGAVGPGGFMEKDLTLSIGRKLRDELVRDGAEVHMTRDSDVRPSLKQRYLDAISLNAGYFISVHCDEAGGRNSHSGTTVYYHGSNNVSHQLARDVSSAVGTVSGIPALGVKSDTIRFVTGFAVLRGSPMPAVLVECGYMNSDKDLALLRNESVQSKISVGIAAGLAGFISHAAGDTASTKPVAEIP